MAKLPNYIKRQPTNETALNYNLEVTIENST